MPLFSAGWLSGYAVTTFAGLSRKLASRSAAAITSGCLPSSRVSTYSHEFNKDRTTSSPEIALQSEHSGNVKPPNVLIYTGPDDTDKKKYSSLKKALAQVLNLHSYAIYKLDDKIITTQPWLENTALLVLEHDNTISQSVQEMFTKYVRGGGKLLSLSGSFNLQVIKKQWSKKGIAFPVSVEIANPKVHKKWSQHLTAICQPFYFEVPDGSQTTVVVHEVNTKRPVIVQVSEGDGIAFFNSLQLVLDTEDMEVKGTELNSQSSTVLKDSCAQLILMIFQLLEMKCFSDKMPELTPAFLLASKRDEQHVLDSLHPSLQQGVCRGKDVSLCFVPNGENLPKVSEKMLPVVTGIDHNCIESSFGWRSYYDQLQTRVLGKVMLYTSVIGSTQTVFDGNFTFVQNIPEDVGVVIVASQQVKGQGRGGNVWLSPIGCMMFSLLVRIPFGSELGCRPPYLQHIASLAAVEAITSLPGYENIGIHLKWPNDIYFGKERKIGGVIVTSSATGGMLNAVIGMGINVANEEPTLCVNEIISRYNKQHKTNLQAVTIEFLMARTINFIEDLIDDFQQHGNQNFLEKYYRRWLHSDATVSLESQTGLEDVKIKGLDDFGFLLVQTESGQLTSVQPDGNTFDMLTNLIAIKQN